MKKPKRKNEKKIRHKQKRIKTKKRKPIKRSKISRKSVSRRRSVSVRRLGKQRGNRKPKKKVERRFRRPYRKLKSGFRSNFASYFYTPTLIENVESYYTDEYVVPITDETIPLIMDFVSEFFNARFPNAKGFIKDKGNKVRLYRASLLCAYHREQENGEVKQEMNSVYFTGLDHDEIYLQLTEKLFELIQKYKTKTLIYQFKVSRIDRGTKKNMYQWTSETQEENFREFKRLTKRNKGRNL